MEKEVVEDIRNLVLKLGLEKLGNKSFSEIVEAGIQELEDLIKLGLMKPQLDEENKLTKVSYTIDWIEKAYPIYTIPANSLDRGYIAGKYLKAYVKETYLFKQTQQKKESIEILKKQNNIPFKIWDNITKFKRTNKKNQYDQQWYIETETKKKAINMLKDSTLYFPHQYDKRGRIYADCYILNYQQDEWTKASLMPSIKKQKLTQRGMLALKIEVANHFGYDKLTYKERLQMPTDDLSLAKKPILAKRANEFLEKAIKEKETDYMCSIDATASGMQILAIISNCHYAARVTNLVDTNKCYDVYSIASQEILNKTNKDKTKIKEIRDIVKKSLMTRNYNSTKQIYLAQIELSKFNINISLSDLIKILDMSPKITACKDSMNNLLCNKFSKLPDEDQVVQYTMPDGFIVQFANIKKAMSNCKGRLFNLNIKYDKLGWDRELNWRALSPNIIHSIDAYICRELIRRCNFTIITIHDSFSCHPNNIDTLRLEYIKILKEIQQINILDYIGKQIDDSYSWQPEGEQFTIAESIDSYCLC